MKMMRFFIIGILVAGLFACAGNQDEETATQVSADEATTEKQVKETAPEEQLVEVACGTCMLGLECDSCKLAVKIDDKAYFVDGIDIETYAEDGLCSVIKKAKVQGKLADNTFKATKIEIVND